MSSPAGSPRRSGSTGSVGSADPGTPRTVSLVTLGCARNEVDSEELAARLAAWTPPAPRYTTGALAKYAAFVSSASEGAITSGAALRRALDARMHG